MPTASIYEYIEKTVRKDGRTEEVGALYDCGRVDNV